MKGYRFDWRTQLPGAALLAAFLLSASLAPGQVAPPAKADDKKAPPAAKKSGDEDPPLPSKKPAPARQVRVQVTAASA